MRQRHADAVCKGADVNVPPGPGPFTISCGGIEDRTYITVVQTGPARSLSVAEIKHRIDTYYMPYHNRLEQLIEQAHYSYGQVWHVNCHSMPAAGRPTGFIRRTVSHSLADFVLGDRNGSSCDLHFTHSMRDFLRGMGYRVDINNPYKGVELVRRHGKPTTGRHSIQLEINKALYWDEQNHCRNRNYDNLKSDLDKLMQFCADYVRANLSQMAAD